MYASASATLYAINDIFVFIVMSYFESSSYTVLVTGKIAVVAFLSRVVLHRFMTKTQYIACILLTVGIITFQSNFCPELEKHKHRGNAMEGYSVVLFSEMVGGVAGILNEYILKEQSRDNLPIHYANSLLYFISLCIYIPVLLLWEHDNMGNVFHDIQYNIIVPMIIVNACRGISISFIYKQSTNMTKIFIVIPGIILTWIVSAIYLDFNFTVQAFLSIIVIFCALYLYMSEEEGKGEEEEGIDGGNEAIGLDNRHDGYSDSGMGKERDDRDVNSTATDGSPMRLSIDDEGKDCSSPAAADVTIHAFESKGHSKDINDGHSTHTVSSGSTFTTASITASSSSSALAKPSSSSASANGGKKYATLLNDPEFGLNDDNESLSDYVEPEKHTLEMTMVMGTP